MKPDERRLIDVMQRGRRYGISAWQLASNVGIPYKRARYIIRDKWTRKGWVEYGVSWRYAWLTDAGIAAALEEQSCSI